ncbi:MAG: helix-turn-helix domain-containing protein [Bacteroidota bacterium]
MIFHEDRRILQSYPRLPMNAYINHQLATQQADVLVERKAMMSARNIELQFYETIAPADQVEIKFETPVIAVMLKGEKRIRMKDLGAFYYQPGESLIIPSGHQLSIDFPSASVEEPTQCLAFVPDPILIDEALQAYYHHTEAADIKMVDEVDFSADLVMRDQAIAQTVNYLLFLFQEHNEHRDLFINMSTRELVIRILQSRARRLFLHNFHQQRNDRFGAVVAYIRENIRKPIGISDLTQVAGMGKSRFFALFKDAFGMTPNDFIISERIRLAREMMLRAPDKSLSQIAFELGYSESGYFTRQFKSVTGCTPRRWLKDQLTV